MLKNFEQKSGGENKIEDSEARLELLLKQNKELKEQIETLERLVTLDPLTEVYNRRFIEIELKNLFEEALIIRKKQDKRSDKKDELSIIFLDIDNFKKINDTYGHSAGDIVLKELSSIIKNNIRSSDRVARYGGEEFIVVLVKASKEDAFKKAEIIRKTVSNKKIKIDGVFIKVTITLGVASLDKEKSATELVDKADKALYHGKQNGKNKTIIHSSLIG